MPMLERIRALWYLDKPERNSCSELTLLLEVEDAGGKRPMLFQVGQSFSCHVGISLFPKQVYLYGVLTPFKGLHLWAA